MSNIIKGERIRSKSILDLSLRELPHIEVIHEKIQPSINEESLEEIVQKIEPEVNQEEEMMEKINAQIEEKLQEANENVSRIIDEANINAKQIEAEALKEKEMIVAEAYQKQEAILMSANEEAQKIRESAMDEKKVLLASVEGEVVETMITLLQHIVSEEISISNDWLKLVVKKMLLEGEAEDVTLLVSPSNKAILEEDTLSGILSKLASVQVNETLNDTTCILQTSQGNVEYDITNGLNKVISQLRMIKGISQE